MNSPHSFKRRKEGNIHRPCGGGGQVLLHATKRSIVAVNKTIDVVILLDVSILSLQYIEWNMNCWMTTGTAAAQEPRNSSIYRGTECSN